jgi:hypothetical protein
MSIGEILFDQEPTSVDVTDAHESVAKMTRDLFGGAVSVRSESDPETDAKYFVVYAEAHGDVDGLVELTHQWHVKLGDAAALTEQPYCLSLVLE